ncbi:hypothetical protein DL93DRAFT_2093265 [Clavulina sp. PMI_390]|nr:hypothetical protein DL93DRAFT_2093265 [Clavulina sp. PMI_390]
MVASSILRASFVVLGLLAPALAAPGAQSVLTPYGQRPSANVHAVPEGGEVRHVGDEVHLVDATGNVLHVAQNDGTKVRAQPTPASDAAEALATGWIAYASWSNTGSSPISSFTTTWKVPAIPAKDDGQTLFTFNSIEPASGNAILQPVLQYGPSAAGGGKYYAVASWYLVGSNTYYTTPVKVAVGDTLDGKITLTSSSGSSYNYNSVFTNISGTSLAAKGSAELTWATETLEVYSIASTSDFPTGSTVFSSINLKTKAGTPSVTWSAKSSSADGVTTTVNTQGATNAKITIKY